MKTITKAQYLYLKSKKNAYLSKNETVTIEDEEYEDLIQYSNKQITPINNDPIEPEPIEPTPGGDIPISGEEDPENSEEIYEIYENENNELILNIKNNKKYKIYSKDDDFGYEYELEVNYGENNITDFINYCYIDKYSYNQYYTFTLIEINSSNYYKVLFNLKNDKSFYSSSIINEPMFNFYVNSYDSFSLELINPLIIKHNYNNKEIIINDINQFDLYIYEYNSKGGAFGPSKKINYIKSSNKLILTFNYNFITQYNHSQYNVSNFDNSTLYLRISYDIGIIRNNYILIGFTTQYLSYNKTDIFLFTGPKNGALMYKYDKYNIYKTYGKQLINNIENNNANNINIINYYIKCIYENNILTNNLDSLIDDNMYDYLCQIFNCQKDVLNIYYTYEYSQLKNLKDNNVNDHIYVNNNLIVGDYKEDKVTYNNWYAISALIGKNYLEKYNKFKLFVTINNIDYIILNCGWDITTDNEHYLIDSESGEKIIIE